VVFGYLAGFNYWFPKAMGFKLNETLGKCAFWFWITGFFVAFLPLYALGFMGMTRRLSTNINPEYHTMLMVAVGGAVLILIGILFQLLQLVVSIKDRNKNRDLTGDPWGGRTLEWATSSPPPFYNFAEIPVVTERDAFWDMKEKGTAYKRPAAYKEIHMPKNTGAGVIISLFSLVMGFALIWYIWWLAILGAVGVAVTWIAHSFNNDVDYYVPVDVVEKTETQHFEKMSKAGVQHGN
jgi:cytochrome bo3 quinol oxidase subunit 1 apoprotein (EC 1.10.3.-)